MPKTVLFLIVAFGVAAFVPARAEDPGPPEARESSEAETERSEDRPKAPDVEVVVRAEFRDTVEKDVPASVAVLDEEVLDEAVVQHVEEAALFVPNLDYSGEGNRPRYWQIRGIGEREEYRGAPNPSVGFFVDDVDLSGIGGVATAWGIDQVEVLRGPQGTRFGANALAGAVYMRSAPPPDAFEMDAEITLGTDAAQALGVGVGGPIGDGRVAYRIGAQTQRSDGFRDNRFLDATDTNGRDETTVRGKLRIEPNESWTLDLTGFLVDADNGYDAFTIDNGFDTESDRPGRDAQRTLAGSLRATGRVSERFSVVSITSAADSDAVFSFDADWGNDDLWAPYTYDFFSETRKRRTNVAQEIRLVGAPVGRTDWVAGLFASRMRETNDTTDDGLYVDPAFPDDPFVLDASIARRYEADHLAAFGETTVALAPRTRLGVGLRLERRAANYRDDAGDAFDPVETMVGGQVTLTREISNAANAYARIARGYKPGGFNLGLPADAGSARRLYDAEFLWNYEVGYKMRRADGRLAGDVVLFYSDRDDQQVEISTQLDPNNPTTFVFLTDNAGRGRNAGAEASVSWQATRTVRTYAAVGWLDTEIVDFPGRPALEGRDQAHAPRFSGSTGAVWRDARGRFARVDVVGKSSFYFDDSHDRRSDPYALVHLRLGLERERFAVHLWVRNLFDETWATRGFYFGNEPPDFPDRLYVKRGDPRQAGITVRFRM